MRLIYYYGSQDKDVYLGDSCIHITKPSEPFVVLPDIDDEPPIVMFESFNPEELIIATHRLKSKEPIRILNGLWVDVKLWGKYYQHLKMFDEYVLVPFNPDNPEDTYVDCLDTLLSLASYHNIPKEKLIIDVCIKPQFEVPNLQIYTGRIRRFKEQGYKTLAAFDNFIYRQRHRADLLNDIFHTLKGEGLDYAIIEPRTLSLVKF